MMYQHFLQLIFTTIFIAACWNSISKFNEARIAVALQEIDIVDVQYPSVRSINMKKLFLKKDMDISIEFKIKNHIK